MVYHIAARELRTIGSVANHLLTTTGPYEPVHGGRSSGWLDGRPPGYRWRLLSRVWCPLLRVIRALRTDTFKYSVAISSSILSTELPSQPGHYQLTTSPSKHEVYAKRRRFSYM